MSSLMESINNFLSGDRLSKISKQVGLPEDKARQVIPDVSAVITVIMKEQDFLKLVLGKLNAPIALFTGNIKKYW